MSNGIAVRNLNKSFGRAQVLWNVSFEIGPGEFVGLMGPNGAGKSTLIKILDGLHEPDSGVISYGGQEMRNLAQHPEVAFIHQDLGLIEDLSIVENLRLGGRPLRLVGPILDRRKELAAAERAVARVNLTCPVTTLIGELSPGEKSLVAIARALDRGAKVLFIDEATSTLPPGDARRLIQTLKATVADGATVVMVSHKLSEILDSCQRLVILLDGRVATDVDASDLDRAGLVDLLVAHESRTAQDRPSQVEPGEELLRLEGVVGGNAGPVEIVVRRGEVVGLTGLVGSGLHDIAHLANGTLRPRSGSIVRAPGTRTALVPPHRETEGGFDDLSVRENLTITALRRWRTPARLLRSIQERKDALVAMTRLSVKPTDPEAVFGTLSGGNKQKVVFGRALLGEADLYVLCEPTRGVDIATRQEIYALIAELREAGAGVLVVTSDAEDLFAVCTQIGVCEGGRVSDLLPADKRSATELEAFV